MDRPVDIVTTPQRTLAVVCFHCAPEAIPARIGDAFSRVGAYLAGSAQPMEGPAVAFYRMREGGFDVRAGFPGRAAASEASGVFTFELPAVEAAMAEHIGPYDTLPATYDRIRTEVEARGRQLDDTMGTWEEYWSPPGTPPDAIRTVIFWPLLPA